MQGNQNVLPVDRRQAVWEKKRLMEFLAALKKDPLCHNTSPSETVSGLSSVWGCDPAAPCSPHLLHHPDCLHPHAFLGMSLLGAPLKL